MTALNYLAFGWARKVLRYIHPTQINPLLHLSQHLMNDLCKTKLPIQDRRMLQTLFQAIDPGPIDVDGLSHVVLPYPAPFQFLINISQCASIAAGNNSATRLPPDPLQFSLNQLVTSLGGAGAWRSSLGWLPEKPLYLRSPEYAAALLEQTDKSALVEFCPFGCGRDDHFALAQGHSKFDFPTTYLLHNHDIFDPQNLMKEGSLFRDEAADLMYVQQTNQDPPTFYRGADERFPLAARFDEEDRRIQAMNALSLFLDRPHFFKHPALRHQFETKVFSNEAFDKLLESPQNLPFVFSILHKLAKEVQVSHASGEIGVAAFLVFIAAELLDIIEGSLLTPESKAELRAAIPFAADDLLSKWTEELIGKSDESAREKQKVVFPLQLNRYFKKFSANPSDPCFENDRDLEMMLCMIGRLEGLAKGKDKLDPELRDRYLSLLSWIAPRIRSRIENDPVPGNFIQRILFYLNPGIAALNLPWEIQDFPTMLALDSQGQFYQFDLLTGRMSFGKNRIEPIPENLKHNPSLQRMFGDALNKDWQAASVPEEAGTIVYLHADFPNHRIIVRKPETAAGGRQRESNVAIERKIQGEWMAYIRFGAQDKWLAERPVSEPDIPLQIAALIGDRDCWISRKSQTVLVLEPNREEPFAVFSLKRVRLEKGEWVLTASNVHLLKENTYLLGNRSLDRFSTIENPKYIQVIGKKHRPIAVDYLRYRTAETDAPLSYELNKKGIFFKTFPGFRLEAFGKRPGKPELGSTPLPLSFDGFHLLAKEGKEKVLIPLRQFDPLCTHTGDKLPQSSMSVPDNSERCPVFEYGVDPETNRLTANSGEAYAYLAYLCLAHWDYDSANYYLNKARTSAGYGERYEKILAWEMELNDPTPNGIALHLRFELFREEALQDGRMREAKEGKLPPSTVDSAARMARLGRIADLYKRYCEAMKARIAAKTGGEVTLDLTPSEEETALQLIQELIEKWGDQEIPSPEALFVRAQAIGPQKYLQNDKADALGINEGAKRVWLHKGNRKSRSPLTFQNPEWILRDFSDLFNRLLELDAASPQFLQLERQIRLASEGTAEQSYLLKLIAAKKDFPAIVQQIKKEGPLRLEGPYFRASRDAALAREEAIFSDQYFDKFALRVPVRAKERALRLMGIKPERDALDLSSFGNRALRFVEKWERKSGNFESDFHAFLMRELYGSSGARCLERLNQAFKILEPIPIDQIGQQMETVPPNLPKPVETYRSKYGSLATLELEDEDPISLPSPALGFQIPVVSRSSSILEARYGARFNIQEMAKREADESVFDHLRKSAEPAFIRVAEEHRSDLRSFEDNRKSVFLSLEEAQALQQEMRAESEQLEAERADLRRTLLQDVELFNTPAGILAMRRLVGKGIKPSLETLISLWRRGEIAKAWPLHSFRQVGKREVSASTLGELDRKIGRYLELSTRQDHLKRISDLIEGFLSSPLDPHLAEGLFDAVSTQRHYALDDPDARDLLFLEYEQGIVLRKQQVEILRQMLADPNAVRQLRMGDGKSKVLLPILAQRKANGSNLVMLMLPEELYETNCRDLDAANRHLFGQPMLRFDFSRKSDKSEAAVKRLYMRLLKTVQEKGYVMTTKRSLLSFRNSYLELFYKLQSAQNSPETRTRLLGQIRAMSQILQLFSERTDVIADEIDACLDVRKEVNFSLGTSVGVDPVKTKAGIDLMHLILSEEMLEELASALQNNTQAALSPQRKRQLLYVLASAYYLRNAERFGKISLPDFIEYVANEESAKPVEEWVLALEESNRELFQEISAVKAFLDRGFGTTLGRIGNVNYGRDPVSGMRTIPYRASNTPHIGSEFDDDIEKIAFTIQDYLQNGVTFEQVFRIISRMRNRAIVELRQSKPEEFLNINDTEAGKEFKAFLQEADPDRKIGHHVSLAMMDAPQNIETLVAIINENPRSRLAFCHNQVIGKMRQFPSQIHSVSADVPELVRSFGGFTGTPWNLRTYHDKIHAEKNLGVDGSTWSLILSRDIDVRTFAFDAQKPIDSLLQHLDRTNSVQALIDTGAYLRGTNNSEFIDRCLEQERFSAGIYFDDAGRIVKKIPGEEPLPIESAPPTDPMETITLYSQAQTVGADIKQGRKAHAVVTIGENTFIRDLLQAVWRLRQLDREQTFSLAVSEAVKERILGGERRELTKEDILKFCLMNEASREAEDNFRAEKEKIHGAARRLALSRLADLVVRGADEETVVQAASACEDLFIKQRPGEEAYVQYGMLKTQETPSSLLADQRLSERAKCERLKKALEPIDPETSLAFHQLSQKIAARPSLPGDWCPSRVSSAHQEGGEVEVEAQAEIEQETEIATETEQELEVAAEVLVPQVLSGSGGHGDVYSLREEDVRRLIETDSFDSSKLRNLSHSLEFFDPEIYVSAMFERNLSESNRKLVPQSIFYSNRKPVKHAVISKFDGRWTMILPTMHEAHRACRGYFAGANGKAVQLAVSPTKPILVHRSGDGLSDELPFETPSDREQFYRLYVQAKLFNGEIEYTSEERDALKRWLLEKGPEKFKEYFEANILPVKPRRFHDAYPKSSLARAFQEAAACA